MRLRLGHGPIHSSRWIRSGRGNGYVPGYKRLCAGQVGLPMRAANDLGCEYGERGRTRKVEGSRSPRGRGGGDGTPGAWLRRSPRKD